MSNANDEINEVLYKMNKMSALESERIRMWNQVGGYPRNTEAGVYNMADLSTANNSLYQLYINNTPPYFIKCPTDFQPFIQRYKQSFVFCNNMKQLQFTQYDKTQIYFLVNDQSLFGGGQVLSTFRIAFNGKNSNYIIYICMNDAIAIVDMDKNWNVSWNEFLEDLDRELLEEKYNLIEKTIIYQCAYDCFNKQAGSRCDNFQAFDPCVGTIYHGLKLVALL